uniref:Uncharacterized protein n=1 Tax=Phlebotomus papatasi TaxID=29031 RepID=A0A1B0CZD5_PHLPP
MQCGVVESMNNDCERSPNRAGLRVNFSDKGEVKERREKFLTAKYGSHQMSLIRKRLAVEMWLFDELQKLFDPSVALLKLPKLPIRPDVLFSCDFDNLIH